MSTPTVPSVETHPFRIGALFFRTEADARTFGRECVENGISPIRLVDRRTETVIVEVES